MKRILNYPGSKWSMADLIISQFPKHKSYLEPYMGSLAVFLNKPKDVLETINDIDGRLVNLFTVMRDEPEKLQYLVYHTLYSREEYVGGRLRKMSKLASQLLRNPIEQKSYG